VAGGIGITPIKAMIESLPPQREWELAYFGRSRATMAFLPELLARYPEQVSVYARDESEERPDLARVLAASTGDVYCCGPEPLVSAVAEFVPSSRLHLERFLPVVREAATAQSVVVTCARSNTELRIAPDENILEALEARGLPVVGSCRKGVCGSCEVRVLDGTPEHLDSVMDDAQKDELGVMYPCVSRATSQTLVLDL
jgi:ferredoxin